MKKYSGQIILGGVGVLVLLLAQPVRGAISSAPDSTEASPLGQTKNTATASSSPAEYQTPSSPAHRGSRSFIRRVFTIPESPHTLRLVAWGGFSIVEAIAAYDHTLSVWGKPNGKFHLKKDFKVDRMALTDEFSHLFISFKLAQITRQGFRWTGLSPAAAARAGAIQAALYMTFVEFPLDAYNPKQGLGLTDLAANFLGIGLAWYRAGRTNPRWDLKASVKSQFFESENRFIAHTDKQYDDYIYWLTCRVSSQRYNPLVLGIGYSTNHVPGRTVQKELHLRIGTSFSEIGRLLGRRTESLFSPAEFYYFSVGPRLPWR